MRTFRTRRRGTVSGRAVIKDVARLAGVSSQTVSRVLNEYPNVSPGTRERVLEAVRQLGYRRNAMARGLAARRSRIVGVVTLETVLHGPAATLFGVERAARAEGYSVSVSTLERIDHRGVLSALSALADQSVAGVVVIAPQGATARALRDLQSAIPVVAVGADTGGQTPVIGVDQRAGARMAVEHLIGLGHREVWHLAGPPDWLESWGRIDGWRSALEDAGLRVPDPMAGDWSARSGYTAGLEFAVRASTTAIFAGNDQMALGLLRAFHERGIRVPEDVSVVGFDDIPEAAFLCPPLTTIRQDFDEVGRRCVAALLHTMETDRLEPVPVVVPTLIARDSTARVV
ncbi:LacI family DNA-binding transcriptional regulator [Dactylosporangium sp. CA-139066]|uniref:LacI family DNA-binding transcriptional regulator n=1 Tax=Dactylosporangium sp. CA-139066 TaxID=3239930 RepID=UPI003D8B3CCB